MRRLNFNDGWQVEKGSAASMLSSFLGNEQAKSVHLPHDAMILEERKADTPNGAQTGFYPGGQYIYQKNLFAPAEWKEKTVCLEFEGVYQNAAVYINGALAASNFYGYSNFYVDLNPWLNFGADNKIKVIADNTMEPNSRWYTGSGIYRNVGLWIGEKVHIPQEGLRLTTLDASEESAVVEAEIRLKNAGSVREKVLLTVTFEKDGKDVLSERQTVYLSPGSSETARCSICIPNPGLWSCEDPQMYTCAVTAECAGKMPDEVRTHFGIRTLSLDTMHGLRINGKTVKLRGACIHHDNGILGAATLESAELRRCRQLKEAGFNSIRSSHHPISKAMLDACDKTGMLVMDELSDMWTIHKNPYDFALHFQDCWEETVERMVAKDYNHPCVILYSVGNEISEAGSEAGAMINRKLCNRFHELDRTRYTTNALNGLMAAGYRLRSIMQDVFSRFGNPNASGGGNQDGSNGFNSFMSLMEGERGEYFSTHPLLTEALEGCSSSCDIIGLNYLTGRHVMERELHPNKTVLGTETYPADIVRLWGIVKRYPHVLGDFTWTGYDYLGEAGCGIFHYDGKANFSSIYPERTAYIGDLDLIGYRRPISYLREIVYGLRKQPYIAVERVSRYGKPCAKTPWMHKDNISSWTWTGFEGKPAVVDIYADAQEVELFLNGRSLGKKPTGEACGFTATYETVYEPGELLAVSYENGEETGRFTLYTAKETIQLLAEADRHELAANGEDLAFITVKLVDEDGVENLYASRKVHVSVEGAGALAGFGSADPQALGSYQDTAWETYDGYVMAVVRAGTDAGTIRVTFDAEGCEDAVVEISALK